MAMLSPGLARSHSEASASAPCGKAPSPRAVRRAGAWRAAAVALGWEGWNSLAVTFFSASALLSVIGAPLRSPDLGSVSGQRVRRQPTGFRMWL